MKVLFVTHYWEMLGANRSMLQLIKEVRDLGVTPLVLGPKLPEDKTGTLALSLEINNIEYISYDFKISKGISPIKNIARHFFNRLILSSVVGQLRNENIELVHSNSSVIDFGALIARKLSVPHIWHLREFGLKDYNLKTPFGENAQKMYFKGGAVYIAISNIIKEHFRQLIPANKLEVIYNGIKFDGIVAGHRNEVTKFCLVGYMMKGKNQLDALKAVKVLKDRCVKDFKVTFIGGWDDCYLGVLKQYIRDNDLDEYIDFTGQIGNVSQVMSTMDVGLMLSESEAFGRVTVEYMMHNLAVIASDAGANPEIIEDGITGILYPLHDHISLADKMQLFIENHSILEKYAKCGYESAMRQFQSTVNSSKIYQLYNRLLNNAHVDI